MPFQDSALGNIDTTSTTLATADALTVSVGSLVIVEVKGEGNGTGTTIGVDNGTGPTFYNVAKAVENASVGTATNDLWTGVFWWISNVAGTINPRMVLGAGRTFLQIKAQSFTPVTGGNTWQLGTGGAAPVSAQQTGATAMSAGALTASGAGVVLQCGGLYGTRNWSAAGWSIPAEYTSGTSLTSSYQLPSGAGTITSAWNLTSGAIETISQMVFFAEVAAGSTQNLAGAAAGQGGATGAAAVTKPVQGAAAGQGGAGGTLAGGSQQLGGNTPGQGGATGNLGKTDNLAGGTAGQGGAGGTLLGGATITMPPGDTGSGSAWAAHNFPLLLALRLSDGQVVASWANQVANGAGVLSLFHANLVAGQSYAVLGWESNGGGGYYAGISIVAAA